MTLNIVYFRFYEELNDRLPAERRKRSFAYEFPDNPSVKDAIESMGVPHTEVDLILANGVSVAFDYRLQDGDRVSVYPVFENFDISKVTRLRPEPLRIPRFILDVHLGKLARLLRMLGFDALYRNDYADREIIDIARDEKRIILTRDRGILKNRVVTHGYGVRQTAPLEQAREVVRRFDLFSQIRPFSRCMQCNECVVKIDKHAILNRLPPQTARSCDAFCHCPNCGRIYWKGSHYKRMQAKIPKIIENSYQG